MIHRPPRRVLAAFILSLCVLAAWLPGRSAQALQAMPAASAAPDLPSWLWQTLAGLGLRPQEGCSLDPSGHCLGGQQARHPAVVVKVGCSLDPDGQCVPSRARIGRSAPAQGCSRGPRRCLSPQGTAAPSSRGNRGNRPGS